MKIKKTLKNSPKINCPKSLFNKNQEIDFKKPSTYFNKILIMIIIAIICTTVVAGVVIKKYIVGEYNIVYVKTTPDDKKMLWTYSFTPKIYGDFETQEEALAAEKEVIELISQNKAENLGDGIYSAVLANGREVTYDTSGLPLEILKISAIDRKPAIKQLTDEIEELHDKGQYTKEYVCTKNIKGVGDVVINAYTYTLSSGHQITVRSNK